MSKQPATREEILEMLMIAPEATKEFVKKRLQATGEEMSETIEKAQERERILFEGHTRFAEIKKRFFAELWDMQSQPEAFSCLDYCRIGFSQGYIEGYRKAKGETQPETKTGNPMPEILPGYALQIDSNVYAVLQSNGGGIWFSDYGLRCKLKDKEKIFQIWNRDGVSIWSKE